MRNPSSPYRFGLASIAAGLAAFLLTGASAFGQRGFDADQSGSAPIAVQYAASNENFPNPERGFYRQLSPFNLGTFRNPLDAATLRRYRDEGISILRAYYIIDEFRNTPFPADALTALNADFAAVRSAGIKIIPRFTYSFPCVNALEPCSPATYGETDTSLPQVLAHIDQLAPVLQANADVIAFMEMGFIGAWGEWHDSTNGLLGGPFTANENSAAIVARLLSALPARRMANIPLIHQKQAILGVTSPLTSPQAFSGTSQARIGHQDDCLLANATNGNTYVNHYPPANYNPEPAKQYLNLDNRYVPQGGESCSFAAEAQPFVQCSNALAELARIRWSALNIQYQPQVLDLWRQQGCFGDIARRLGYRFRLLGAEVPSQGVPGGWLSLRLAIANDGFASPYNPRAVEFVLRHTMTRREYALSINVDPRFWSAGETQVLDWR